MRRVIIQIAGVQVGWLLLPSDDQALSQAMRMIDPFQTESTRPIMDLMLRYLDTKGKHA